ncbi:conjugal transfer protein TraK [Raoultella planticola]|uniref:Conjugal transfer protein TraK n=1 Tax=Raoultella planticola TaxID=575 RepID=A0A485D4A2_RAOPL|nr:conjugal transfer protein TraK [Raoultella planticola]
MKKINPLFISGCLFFMAPAMSVTMSGTLAPTVVPLANGGQANIAVSNTDPNLFTVTRRSYHRHQQPGWRPD